MTGVLFLVCAALQSCVRPRQKSPRASLSERGGAILSFEPRNMSAVIFITANSSRGHHGSARPGSDGACKSGLKKAPRRLVGAWAGLVWRACQCRNATPGMMCIGCAGRGQRHRAASRHRSTKRPGCVDLVRACPRWHRTTSKLSLPTRGGSGSNDDTGSDHAVFHGRDAPASPCEQQAGADLVPLCNPLRYRARCKRLLDNPKLVHRRPLPPPFTSICSGRSLSRGRLRASYDASSIFAAGHPLCATSLVVAPAPGKVQFGGRGLSIRRPFSLLGGSGQRDYG